MPGIGPASLSKSALRVRGTPLLSIRNGLVIAGAALATLLVAIVAGGAIWLRGSLPDFKGSLRVPGIVAPVSIIRDGNGVPHIFAARETDAYFALGYVHASDRMWQMDLMRRLAAGRLAEIFGEPALESDRLMRVLGLYRLAEQAETQLPPVVQKALASYADGINAWMTASGQNLPPEFAILRYRPEPWQPADSVVWGKLMAWQLAGNMREELLRARLNGVLTPKMVGQLLPSGIGTSHPPKLEPEQSAIPYPAGAAGRLADVIGGAPLRTWASNVWALDPERTSTGGAILANDPHLGLSVPIPWYLARVESPMLTVRGATVPGVPFMVLGHNRDISWGITNTGADVQDLLIFDTDPDDDSVLRTPEGAARLTIREEQIGIRGGDPEMLRVRTSSLGPVISDLALSLDAAIGEGQALVLAFTALGAEDSTAAALYALNHAEDWTDTRLALADWAAPPLNFVYADTSGHIGFAVAGKIPIREPGDGLVPEPASLRQDPLAEFISHDRLPRSYQPAAHVVANANNDPAPEGYRYFLADSFEEDARKRRLDALIAGTERHGVENTLAMQADILSLAAEDLLPLMMKIKPRDPAEADLFADLRAWDGSMARGRSEPLVFATWMRELTRALFKDELAEAMGGYMNLRPSVLKSVLTVHQGWCDDKTTQAQETCEDMLRLSLRQVQLRLEEAHGANRAHWRWGDEHVAALQHPLFSRLPLAGWLGDLSRATDGGPFTLNRGGTSVWNDAAPFAHTHGAGFRAVYDMADLEGSRFVIATGQSGNPMSHHYGSMVDLWREGEAVPLGGSPEELIGRGLEVLTLRPDAR